MEGIAMKHYSKEFKEEALKLSDEIGVKKAAQQLGIAYYTLADWRSIRRNTPPAKTPSADEQTIRIRELEPCSALERVRLLPVASKQGQAQQPSASCGKGQKDSRRASG